MARFKPSKEKVVAITGAASGLGKELSLRLAASGWSVHLSDINEQAVRDLAAELVAAGHRAFPHTLDVTDSESCRQTVRSIVEVSGGLDVWINNAGVLYTGPAWELSPTERQLMLRINSEGTINGTLAALEYMIPAEKGHVVNTASLAALVGVPGEAVYAASKHAVVGFSTSLASDLRVAGHKKIHLSTVCPDGMWTPMLFDTLKDDGAAMSFSGVLLQPEDVARHIEKVVSKPKAVKTIPRWRGFLARTFALVPGFAPKIAPLLIAKGKRAQKKLAEGAYSR